MKTLAIDCRMARMSGIGVYLRNLAPRCMNSLKDDVRFRLLGYDGAFRIPEGVSYEVVPFGSHIYSIEEQYRILPLLRGCDALWCPHYPVPILASVPLVVTVHDLAHLALPKIFTRIQRLYAGILFQAVKRKAKEIIFVSTFSQQEFLRLVGVPSGIMSVVHNGIENIWFEEHYKNTVNTRKYFLAIGNIKPHKNIEFLCSAFSQTANKHDIDLKVVGKYDGFRSKYISIEKLKMYCPDRIHFTGEISQKKIIPLMRGASALVFPSIYEGFGLPPVEALAAGIPVIASDIPPVRETCGAHARYFALGDEQGLVHCLLEAAYMNSNQHMQRIISARKHAQEFTWDRSAALTTKILQRVL